MSDQPTASEAEKNDPATLLARKRLSVLELAEQLGNVAEACRRGGMDRTSFYNYKRRFQLHGLDGLKDLAPVATTHPQTTPDDHVQRIVALALEHPAWGCNRVSEHLALAGVTVSYPTVQHILNRNGLGTRDDRLRKLEERAATEATRLSAEQIQLLEDANPEFRERRVKTTRPGALLTQATYSVSRLTGIASLYMHTVVDTYGSYAFACLQATNRSSAAVAFLQDQVLPFYKARSIPVIAILTSGRREYRGGRRHAYGCFLASKGIAHQWPTGPRRKVNGFDERFRQTLQDEFFTAMRQQHRHMSVDDLRRELDGWLAHYNLARPHHGYRNNGKRPIDLLNAYLEERALAEPAPTRLP